MKYYCNKSLYNELSGKIRFKKGKIYECTNKSREDLTLLNELGRSHIILKNSWGKHFEKVTLSFKLKHL